MTRTALRLLAATVAACVALLLGAAPAFAHTRLESSNPTDKSTVDAAPESVSLTFNEDISAEFATMSVVGPDGTNYQTGQVSAAGGQVSTAVSPLGPAGVYQIGYRVVSDDAVAQAEWPMGRQRIDAGERPDLRPGHDCP